MAERAERVELGFTGGQVSAVRLNAKVLKGLRAAMSSGEDWHELEAEDGVLSINIATVSFIRVERSDQAIGFAGS